jgi:ABC-2 type transport system ATP-binding protein
MRGFLRSLAAEGRSVLVSSHLMGELEDVADHLVIVGRGRVIASAGLAELIAAASRDRVVVRTPARSPAVMALEDAGAVVTATGPDTLIVTGLGAAAVVSALGASAVPFSEVSAERATLERAYLELTQDAVEYRASSSGPVTR